MLADILGENPEYMFRDAVRLVNYNVPHLE